MPVLSLEDCEIQHKQKEEKKPRFKPGQSVKWNSKIGSFMFYKDNGREAAVSFPTGVNYKVPLGEITEHKPGPTSGATAWTEPTVRSRKGRERIN